MQLNVENCVLFPSMDQEENAFIFRIFYFDANDYPITVKPAEKEIEGFLFLFLYNTQSSRLQVAMLYYLSASTWPCSNAFSECYLSRHE